MNKYKLVWLLAPLLLVLHACDNPSIIASESECLSALVDEENIVFSYPCLNFMSRLDSSDSISLVTQFLTWHLPSFYRC